MYSPIYNSKYIPLFIMRTYAHIPTRIRTRTPSPPRTQEKTPHPKRKKPKPEKPKNQSRKFKAGKMPEISKPKKTQKTKAPKNAPKFNILKTPY